MSNTISIGDWVEAVDREYLSTFIGDGGSSVKFAVADSEGRAGLIADLSSSSDRRDFVFCQVDANTCRVHMPQDIYFTLAKHVDWRELARRVILRLLERKEYDISGVDPASTENVIEDAAKLNFLEPGFLMRDLRLMLQENVFKNPGLVRAFRIAMSHLCLLEREGSRQEDYRGQALLDWLTGDNLRIGPVRGFDVNTIINRTTARYMIESALHWIRFAGLSGTVIVLDNSRVTVARNPQDGKRYFTKPMTLDHYELLREFIDDIGKLHGLFLVVSTDYAFIDDDSVRGWGIYSALRTRVMDDVKDRNVVNPVSSLVRLTQGDDN